MKPHNCPYLDSCNYCTHKAKGPKPTSKGKRHCGYDNPFMCDLLYKSKSLLTELLRACKPTPVSGVKQ